ncbi:MAG: phenylalanyl-tRNA synthetase alpha chain, partial [Thermoplasmata archaeon]|nr:phenylalanyl-tRNA synthetase alpha chain [Thermoplasmata archaeon]
MAPDLSLAEKRLLLALPRDGSAVPITAVRGFQTAGDALQAASGPERHGLVSILIDTLTFLELTTEGNRAATIGLPEWRAVQELRKFGPLSIEDLADKAGLSPSELRVVPGLLKKNGWADLEKTPAGLMLKPKALPAKVPLSDSLRDVALNGANAKIPTDHRLELIQRSLARDGRETNRHFVLTEAGQNVARTLKPDDVAGSEVNQLTPELVTAWATMTPEQKARQRLRPFDFNVDVAVPAPGKAHPLTHIITEIRDIFVALGFQEIAGDYVEPAFWNMDALFIPQDHPARDMQDTFYVKDPARLPVDDKLFETVKKVQQTGGSTGSTGWGGSFKREESERALLRTHTTVTTIRHLAAHPQGPTRVFGIGRVFRNEAMDATHLPEFHQVEGIVVEDGATLAMLMGILREFYKRMGFPEVKFRPSFYPYTEPSLDVAVKWNGKWLELGGAGVFRPEVTHPLGVKSPVLAWGLGLERLAMLRLGLT